MKPWRRAVGLFFALLLLQASVIPAPAQAIDLSEISATPNPRLGLAFPGSRTEFYPLMAQAGIGVARISVAWDRVEPSRGTLEWAGLDARVSALQSNGIEPFLTFESNADWATAVETQGVKNARPLDPADWEGFVRAVVDRYDDDGLHDMPGLGDPVRYWQAANEWISDRNRSGGWAGSTDELIAFIEGTHDTIKAEDPNAIFVLGGLAAFNLDVLLVARGGHDMIVRQKWGDDSETVFTIADMRGDEIARIIDERVLPVLEGSTYDVADVHLYGPEERDAARIDFIREVTGRPVLSSECGGPSLDYGGRYTPENHFIAVVERNLETLAAGARFCLWFRLGEGPGSTYGNTRTALYTAEGEAKPGVFAYRMLSRLLDARTDVEKTGPDHFTLHRDGRAPISIGWDIGAEMARQFARESGGDAYCLEDAVTGRLSAAARCQPGDLVLAGRDIGSLLSR